MSLQQVSCCSDLVSVLLTFFHTRKKVEFQTAINTGSSNAMSDALNKNCVLFSHDSHLKSDNIFALIIL